MRVPLRIVGRGLKAARRGLLAPVGLLARWRSRAPDRLLIAPQDIRTTDPTIAVDIYAGYFAFGGQIVNAHGRSPFEIEARSPEWARALGGFGWLRHLRAADTALAHANARSLVEDFLILAGKPRPGPFWEPRVAARRMIAWLSQSPIILANPDRVFYRRFMKGLARIQVFLERELATGLDAEPRLLALIALAEFALCAPAAGKLQRRATRLLTQELDRQVLPDGGHIGRNPQLSIDLLLDLLPLRQAYAARAQQAPAALLNAIDRMIPTLRLYRLGDGTLCRFNGMSTTAPELLATVLAYDDARAQPMTNARHVGYQRLEAGDTVLVVDAGPPPPAAFSERAHAGCLAFELSAGPHLVIVNCGAPESPRHAARAAARTTAAHSTLTVDDTSSCRFALHAGLQKWFGDQILSGPQRIEVDRHEDAGGVSLRAAHDGYGGRFGLLHERRLVLASTGDQLDGEDRLRPAAEAGPGEDIPYALRFHIHPAVRLEALDGGGAVACRLPDDSRWLMETLDGPLVVEESIFFAAPDGARPSEQIVFYGRYPARDSVRWSLRRLSGDAPAGSTAAPG